MEWQWYTTFLLLIASLSKYLGTLIIGTSAYFLITLRFAFHYREKSTERKLPFSYFSQQVKHQTVSHVRKKFNNSFPPILTPAICIRLIAAAETRTVVGVTGVFSCLFRLLDATWENGTRKIHQGGSIQIRIKRRLPCIFAGSTPKDIYPAPLSSGYIINSIWQIALSSTLSAETFPTKAILGDEIPCQTTVPCLHTKFCRI